MGRKMAFLSMSKFLTPHLKLHTMLFLFTLFPTAVGFMIECFNLFHI